MNLVTMQWAMLMQSCGCEGRLRTCPGRATATVCEVLAGDAARLNVPGRPQVPVCRVRRGPREGVGLREVCEHTPTAATYRADVAVLCTACAHPYDANPLVQCMSEPM